jgi:hypothetical protein
MVRTDTSGMLATFLAGTGIPTAEIEDIIRTQFPGTNAAAVALDATKQLAHTNQ